MDSFKIYRQQDIDQLVINRNGETKLGERVAAYPSNDDAVSTAVLANSEAKFVLLGIPEDIGVRANFGIAGAASAWRTSLVTFLNIQSNHFLKGDEILVLGHFEIEEPVDSSVAGLRKKVEEIDDLVYPVIEKIIAAGKTPIVIGGGHNNAFPLIKGTASAKKAPVNVVNIDAHADLRALEGRHSGNGFSYALKENYLNQYLMYGLHQNYNNEAILHQIETNPKLDAVFFEDILTGGGDFNGFLRKIEGKLGLEIDVDCIQHVLSSAETPSGFAANEIRKLILGSTKQFSYLHICEGATRMLDGRVSRLTAKLIAYLVSDFVKAQAAKA